MKLPSNKTWYHLSETAMLHIAALAKNQKSLSSTNKPLSQLITKDNFLINYPQHLSKRNHLNLMITYAKTENRHMMKIALKNAPLCNHHDAATILNYFISDQYNLSKYLTLHNQNPNNKKFIKKLLVPIMEVYGGDEEVFDKYKSNYLHNNKKRCEVSALHIAIWNNHIPVVELLLAQEEQSDIYPDATTSDFIPLVIAIIKQHMDIIKILIKHPYTDINAQTINGITPLAAAVHIGNTKIARYLLKKGANIHISDQDFATPVYRAAEKGDTKMITLLLSKGAIINTKTINNLTPLWIALLNQHHRTVKKLLKHGADPHILVNNKTTLMIAALYDNTKIAQLLLAYGANPSITNRQGETAYNFASSDEIKKLLTQATMCIIS